MSPNVIVVSPVRKYSKFNCTHSSGCCNVCDSIQITAPQNSFSARYRRLTSESKIIKFNSHSSGPTSVLKKKLLLDFGFGRQLTR